MLAPSAKRYKILVVDDELANLQKLKRTFISDYQVLEARSGAEALKILEAEDVDVIITDQRMPNMSGVQFLQESIKRNPGIVRIILTGFTEPEDMIAAINAGRVYKYITKPWEPEALRTTVREALERLELERENERLHRELAAAYERLRQENIMLKAEASKQYAPENIIYASDQMRAIIELLNKIGPTDTTVLIQGETGTGKELIARYLHNISKRRERNFIAVNCGAIPRELIESEFFGHTRGAFTGATSEKKGLFEIADKGTIFLDEIGEAPPELQVKLLRVLQEGEILPVGSNAPRKVDVRIVASTNRDLKSEVQKGRFRQDLFFRLNVFSILIPPLRERKADIIPLANFFLQKACIKLNKRIVGFATETLDAFLSYSWPGNVRELENQVERMVILADEGKPIGLEFGSDLVRSAVRSMLTLSDNEHGSNRRGQMKQAIETLERTLIKEALTRHSNNRTRAARALGISRQALISKIKRYGL